MMLRDLQGCCHPAVMPLTPVPKERLPFSGRNEHPEGAPNTPKSGTPRQRPPTDDLIDLPRRLAQVMLEEGLASAARHDQILRKLLEQQQLFQEHLLEVRDLNRGVAEQQISLTQLSEIHVITTLTSERQEELLKEIRTGSHIAVASELFQCDADLEEKEPISSVEEPETVETALETVNSKRCLETVEFKEGKPYTELVVASQEGSADALPKPSSQLQANPKTSLEIPRGFGDVEGAISLKSIVTSIVTHDRFEFLVTSLIMANAFILCWEVQYQGFEVGFDLKYRKFRDGMDDQWPGAGTAFVFFDWVFGLLFLVEAVAKIACFGSKYFLDGWNWLDFLCVVTFYLHKVASALIPVKPQILRLLRLFRLLRMVRLLGTMHALDTLYIITTAIKGMNKVLLWSVALLTVMLMACALLLVQVLHAFYFSDSRAEDLSPIELERHRKMFEYFGSFTRCLFSMFEITLGNWPPVSRLLAEEGSEWFFLFCVMHKLTIGFAVIGVINGVIMQETFKVAATDDMIMVKQKQRTAKLMKTKMQTLMNSLDQGGDGDLSLEEFEIIAATPAVKTWLGSMEIETDNMDTLFHLLDNDNSGSITVEELVERMPRIKGAARSIDVMAMHIDVMAMRRMLDMALETKQLSVE